jgi:hypothetical protein
VSTARLSFWQQDSNWRISQQSWTSTLSVSSAANSAITNALTNKSAGLASIANQQALTRVTNQFAAAAKAALTPAQTSQLNSTSKSLAATQSNTASTGSALDLLA